LSRELFAFHIIAKGRATPLQKGINFYACLCLAKHAQAAQRKLEFSEF
jgi:hypothetical protein